MIQLVMGHKDVQTTLDIYADCTEDKKKEEGSHQEHGRQDFCVVKVPVKTVHIHSADTSIHSEVGLSDNNVGNGKLTIDVICDWIEQSISRYSCANTYLTMVSANNRMVSLYLS